MVGRPRKKRNKLTLAQTAQTARPLADATKNRSRSPEQRIPAGLRLLEPHKSGCRGPPAPTYA
eukprot:890527-Lingulodinium_polyedra.AAC.1